MSSPYRATYREVDVDKIKEAGEPLVSYAVSGPGGANGPHGGHGSHGSGSGGSGSSGRHAGPAQRGADAGSIQVAMRTGSADGIVVLSGKTTSYDGKEKEIKKILTLGSSGTVDLICDGGLGGKGGDGGDGGSGARGSSGSDATRWSNGSNGGRGGSGGKGGDATSGAPGGKGGSILVEVIEEDTQLLMLALYSMAGGEGGQAGTNGSGGSGGPGGPGGSSYSWTETSYSTDSEGNRTSSTSYHSNPGGSRGPSGSSGSSGSARVHKGGLGEEGRFRIRVKSEEGVKNYKRCYDLALQSFSHESLNADSVYEPGEFIRVFDICGRNVGGMPTPKHRDIITRLVREGWVEPDPEEKLEVPRGLKAGADYKLEGELRFQIGDYAPQGPSDPLELEETLRLRATLPAVSRDFTRYESDESRPCGQFVIRFPVRVSPIQSLHSLAPGQVSRMRWEVVNQSTADLGRESASGRVLQVRLGLEESELDHKQVIFLDEEGNPNSLASDYLKEIPLLKAGEAKTIEVALGVADGTLHYLSSRVRLALELGHLDKPQKTRAVQFREFVTRVARPYNPLPDADILLVLNHGTTLAEVDAWATVASKLGLSLNTWDLSLLGHLDLERSAPGGPLIEQFAGKTIVVLDCEVDSSAGPFRPHRLLAKDQFFRSVARGINFAFLGPNFAMEQLLIRTDCKLREWAQSPELLLEALDDARDEHGDLLKDMACTIKVDCEKWRWQEPSEIEFAKRAQDFQLLLRNEHPDRRYLVVYDYVPEKETPGLVRKRWQLGSFSVVPTLDSAAGTLVHAQVDAKELHSPEHITSDQNISTLLLTKSLDEKLASLDDLLFRDGLPALLGILDEEAEPEAQDAVHHETEPMLALLVDAICVDLANEMIATLGTGWKAGLSAEEMKRSMPLLAKLATLRFSGGSLHPPGSPGGDQLIRMLALTRFCAESQSRWWEWLPPFLFTRRAIALRGQVKDGLEEFVRRNFGKDADLAMDHIARAVKEEKRSHRKAKQDMLTDRKRWRYARSLLQRPLLSEGITTDAEVLATSNSRVLARVQYDEICARDRDDDLERAERVAANHSAREELLRL